MLSRIEVAAFEPSFTQSQGFYNRDRLAALFSAGWRVEASIKGALILRRRRWFWQS